MARFSKLGWKYQCKSESACELKPCALILDVAIAPRSVFSCLSFAAMVKRPGRGSLERKKDTQEAKYWERQAKKECRNGIDFNLANSMPRLLSASTDGDCDFATKFADGVQNALRLVKGHQEQFDTGDLNPGTTHLRSVFWILWQFNTLDRVDSAQT